MTIFQRKKTYLLLKWRDNYLTERLDADECSFCVWQHPHTPFSHIFSCHLGNKRHSRWNFCVVWRSRWSGLVIFLSEIKKKNNVIKMRTRKWSSILIRFSCWFSSYRTRAIQLNYVIVRALTHTQTYTLC